MMEKRYTAKVPASLTQRLYDIGMPIKVNTEYEVNKFTNKVDKKLDIEPPSYAKTLDWLASKSLSINIYPFPCVLHKRKTEESTTEYEIRIYNEDTLESEHLERKYCFFPTWHEAADYGIEKAIELL